MPDLKQLALQIFHETLAAIDISAAMQRKVWREGTLLRCGDFSVDLAAFESVRVVAIGKAAHAMVDGLVALLGKDVGIAGVVSAPVAPLQIIHGVKYFVAGHPVPNEASWKAAEAI